jgi:hypothetical protein
MVSAVSPDWVTAITSVLPSIGGGPYRNADPVLDRRGPDERGVERRPAGDELDALDLGERLLEALELLEPDVVLARHPTRDRLAQRFGLLVDLLEHEVVVAALLRRLGRPVDDRDGTFLGCARDVGDRHARRPQVGDIALLEEYHAIGVGEDGGDVAGQERLPVGEPDDERHVLAGADEPVSLPAMHDGDRVGPLDNAQRRTHGIGEVALVGLLDEVGKGLGVRLRRQPMAARLEPVAELPEVLDDPVVDDRDIAGAVLVGMGVEIVRATVRGPACVGEPDGGMRRAIRDRGLEIGQLAGPLLDEQVPTVIDERDPGRIVAAVFQAPEPLDENGARLSGPRVSNDAAHVRRSPVSANTAAGWSPCRHRPLRGWRRYCEPSARGFVSLDAPPRGPRGRRPARSRVPRRLLRP